MKCVNCEKETGDDDVPHCYDCFVKELLYVYRNNPNVKDDIKYEKQADGTVKEIPIIRGLAFKKKKVKL